MAAFIRIFVGSVLLVSGVEKVISPYQNFMYVLQAYSLFPSWMEKAVAVSVPWAELLVGLFLVLGLWTSWSLRGALLFFASFIVIVGQALLRHLPIDQCGCFGEAIHIPPQVIIIFDSMVFLSILWLLWRFPEAKRFSLDNILK